MSGRLFGPVTGFAAAAVVDKGVNGFLKHTLFVADDDIRARESSISFFKTVVSVDNAAVKVVQVAGGETAAVELNHRADIRRNDRNNVQNHPFGTCCRTVRKRFDHFKAFDQANLLLAD